MITSNVLVGAITKESPSLSVAEHVTTEAQKPPDAPENALTSCDGPSQSEFDQMQEKLRRLEGEMSSLREERYGAQTEAMRREAEIESLRKFLTANDTAHGSDVNATITTINSLASTFAAELALNWELPQEKGKYRTSRPSTHLTSALTQCHPQHPQAAFLLQLSIQAAILDKAAWAVGTEIYGLDQGYRELVLSLDKEIRVVESQPMYARWRSLTYRGLSQLTAPNHPTIISKMVRRIAERIAHYIELLIGSRLTDQAFDDLENETSGPLQDILKKSFQLGEMTRMGIISANYYVILAGPEFRSRQMHVSQSLEQPNEGEAVVSTIGLGVGRHEKLGRSGIEGPQDGWRVPLRAEVLTLAELSEMLSQPPSVISENAPDIGIDKLQHLNLDSPNDTHKKKRARVPRRKRG